MACPSQLIRFPQRVKSIKITIKKYEYAQIHFIRLLQATLGKSTLQSIIWIITKYGYKVHAATKMFTVVSEFIVP